MALPKMTLAEIRTAAQQRSDMVNSTFVSTDEWTSYINGSYFELYDLLVQKFGDNYFLAQAEVTVSGDTDQVALPDDFYKLLGVDLAQSGTADSWISLKPFNFGERNRLLVPNQTSMYGLTNLRYRLQGGNLWIVPKPAGGQKFRIFYVPRLMPLADETATADGVSGWLEYVVVDAAIKAMQKEESDVSVLMAQKTALLQRIEAAAENRDAGSPATVQDTAYGDYSWPVGSGGLF